MKKLFFTIVIVVMIGAAGFAYWYYMMRPLDTTPNITPTQPADTGGFSPLNRPSQMPGQTPTSTIPTGTSTTTQNQPTQSKIVTLRMLSSLPVGGYSASTTGTTTRVRWIDRGRGNIYEASYNSPEIINLSNTVVPKMFKSVWNKNLTSFVGSLYEGSKLAPETVYGELIKQATSTRVGTTTIPLATNGQFTPYELRGKSVPGDIIGYASSPDRNQILLVLNESGNAVGYVSQFNGSNTTRVFTIPMTQINITWPSDSVIAVTTKGSASYLGFTYFINPKNGSLRKVLGPFSGLSAAVSRDGRHILYSYNTDDGLKTAIYSVNAGTTTDAVIRTLADKCAWSYEVKVVAYCGVPSDLGNAVYPDDWYLGGTASSDRLWRINASNGDIKQISSLVDQSDRLLNLTSVDLDPKDHYLFFMNKNDLSLWSFDLTKIK